jgi:hypothetical protein
VWPDTIDLQDHNSPSAQDHSRQPHQPAPYGYGPAAPHQAQTLRRAEQDAHQQQQTSPRVSEDTNGPFADNQRYYEEDDDEVDDQHMNHLHGPNGNTEQDRDFDDGENSDSQDDMDDDMMDKISSSPSIEDGKYTPPCWPPRSSSMEYEVSPASTVTPIRGISPSSSSPFVAPPVHFPIPRTQNIDYETERWEPTKNLDMWREDDAEKHDHGPVNSYDRFYEPVPASSLYPEDLSDDEYSELSKYLLPTDDPLLEDALEDLDEGYYGNEDAWVDEDVNMPEYLPSSDDEDDDFPFTQDSRFIDSGWGGECLRELEDIDFEFVYALHTFVATVEGQANATKGDTMVLLDDSNSYWWLVRVVKDGSIGVCKLSSRKGTRTELHRLPSGRAY